MRLTILQVNIDKRIVFAVEGNGDPPGTPFAVDESELLKLKDVPVEVDAIWKSQRFSRNGRRLENITVLK